MDYITGSALQSYQDCDEVFFSYNIACQWKLNLCDWMTKLPEKAQIRPELSLDFGMPKLHCKVHKYVC